jgi:hypothetical protein
VPINSALVNDTDKQAGIFNRFTQGSFGHYFSALLLKVCHKNKKNFIQPWKPLMVKNRSLDEAKRNPGPPALM